MSTESVMLSNYLILCCPLLFLPSIFPRIKVFSSESALRIRWPKDWSFTSASIFPMNIQGWFPLGLTGLIFLLSKGLSRIFSNTEFESINSSVLSLCCSDTHLCTWVLEKPQLWLFGPLSAKQCLCFLICCLDLLWFSFQGVRIFKKFHGCSHWSTVILEPRKIKSVTVSTFPSSIFYEVMGPDAINLVFWPLSFKPAFSLYSFTFIKRLFSSSSLSTITVVPFAYLRLLIFLLAVLIPAWDSSSLAFHRMYSA